ncbi:MAG: GDP-mannose 4,6-dehydratase, partial [Phycisphaerales bacterium]|nr:GDP-mannose 4,6-dehydratase [Phycisphaerales bacterium]
MARVLLTGVTGQDGSYLAESLLAKNCDIHCIVRPNPTTTDQALPDHLQALFSNANVHRYDVDLSDSDAVFGVCRKVEPDLVYHLGGPTRVDSNVGGNAGVFRTIFGSTKALLEAIKDRGRVRLFFAGTSEIFGTPSESPQDEQTARQPRSMYGFAKLAATDLVERHRVKFGSFACTGILYNHESPRREPYFLSRKVTRGLARVSLGLQSNI